MTELTPDQAKKLHASDGKPLKVTDPETNQLYVVVDLPTHKSAMAALKEKEDIAAIRQGVKQMEAGEGVPLDEAHMNIRKNLIARYGT